MTDQKAGRARDEDITRRIMELTISRVFEHGLDSLSFATIANELGVSRSTIYRRWPTKQDLVLESLRSMANIQDPPLTDSVVDDLTAYMLQNLALQAVAAEEIAQGQNSFWGAILTFKIFPQYWDRFGSYHLDYAFRRIGIAMQAGHLPRDTDPVLLVAPLASFLIFRMILGDENGERTSPNAEQIHELVRSLCSDPPRVHAA